MSERNIHDQAAELLMRDVCEQPSCDPESELAVTVNYNWLYERVRDAFESVKQAAQQEAGPAAMTNAQWHGAEFPGWQCFHCGEVFKTVGGARDHFGATPGADPGCHIRVQVGDERGLLMRVRELEQQLADAQQEAEPVWSECPCGGGFEECPDPETNKPLCWDPPQPAKPAVPEGWVLVPKTLPNDMVRAFAIDTIGEWDEATEKEKIEVAENLQSAFDAMLAAAPQPGEGSTDG